MITERLDIFSGDYEKKINRAVELLKLGGIVAIPTETVYGLAARADFDDAIVKVFEAKGRPQDNPLIVHISDFDMIYDLASLVPETARLCAEKFWPGPFTMVLPKTDYVATNVSAGLNTVAVRMPSNTVACDIIRGAGPLAAPSANTSGYPSPTSALHVLADLDGKIDAVVIGGNSDVGVESTVVDFSQNPPRLLRPGGVTVEQLIEILPDLVVDKAVFQKPDDGAKVASPGMKYKHYSPKTETYLVEGNFEKYTELVNQKSNCIAICFDEDIPNIKGKYLCYGKEKDESTLAHNIFDVLRNVDTLNVKEAYIHAPSKTGVGLAVYNRLIRAASFKVIKL